MLGEVMSLRRPSASAPSKTPKPTFPLYLLPSLRIPFTRRRISEPPSPISTTVPSLSTSPTSPTPPSTRRLSRTHPTTLRCRTCSTDLAFHAQIISKCFQGRNGRAYLVAPPSPLSTPSCPGSPTITNTTTTNPATDAPTHHYLANIRVGRSETRQLITGTHVVADISCAVCGATVGWKYMDAREPAQRYKVGKFILETRRVVGFHGWEDVDVPVMDHDGYGPSQVWDGEDEEDGLDSGVVVFDSEDEDECEDMFAGVWDATVVAKRRRSKVGGLGGHI
ncbi:yippee-like protein [Parachaetomium inaequale]|uniref:Yippee-like protein n=1 Tax=Parachaetomium inaequale TaxID=2588326 RepID=A0AAN6PFD4_9PEZI|nr:yippee-like protein [Parachaetomium inaequale]